MQAIETIMRTSPVIPVARAGSDVAHRLCP